MTLRQTLLFTVAERVVTFVGIYLALHRSYAALAALAAWNVVCIALVAYVMIRERMWRLEAPPPAPRPSMVRTSIGVEAEREGLKLTSNMLDVLFPGSPVAQVVAVSEVGVRYCMRQPEPALALDDLHRLQREVLREMLIAAQESTS